MSSNAGGRRKDENWKHVTQEDGKWRCNYCGDLYSGGITRIKVHLNIENGTGISRCSKYGVHNDMASGSSNPPQEEPVMGSTQGEARFDPAQRVQEQVLMSGLEPQNHMSGGLVNHQNNVASGFSYLPNGEARFDPAQGVQGQALTSGPEHQNHMSGGLVNHQNNVATGVSYLPNGEARFDPVQGVQGQALTSGLESQNHMSGGLVNHQINFASGFSYLPNEARFDPARGVQGQALTSGLELQNHTSGLVNHQGFCHLPNEARFDRAQGVQGQALTSGLELQAFPGFSQLRNGMDASIYPKDAFEPEITLLNQLVSGLESDKGDIEQHIHQLECQGKKRKRHVSDWLDVIPKLRIRADNMKNVVHPMPSNDYRREIKQLIGEIQCHKEEMPFVLSTEIVGENFEKNTRKMWKLLGDDQVSIIGIHGMGGVGKTLLASHVKNEIKRKRAFKDVFWVTVSQNSTISKLQHDIAKRIDLKLDEDEEILRAENLCLTLKEKENSVLVLDNVWNYIDFEKVGIPSGFKVIVTTRLKHVCQQMDCLPDNMIKISPLEIKEAEELFKLKLGYNGKPAILSPQVQKIAESVVEHCYRLPLKISVIARTMKGINDIYRWRHAKNKLEMGEEGEEVFKVLKSSYDNLMEKDLQDCFLYVALLPYLARGELIMKLVDKKLINGERSLEKIFDEGNTILDKLKSHSLLWSGAIRNLASNILKESQRHVEVKYGIGLIEEWTKDLELVNCIGSNIKKMPEDMSPFCPVLTTLMLGRHFSDIPKCFFQNMNALTILHISDNNQLKSLPNSLCDLRSLVSLVVRACGSLKYVPPLGELQALSRLVISYCSIDKVPEGLEKLTNLKWLDLSHNNSLTGFVDVLCNLISLQYLDIRGCRYVKIKVKDVQGMKMLECFGGTFLDHNDYNNYVENILDKHLGPKTYYLLLANFDASFMNSRSILPSDPRTKTVYFLSKDFPYSPVLPKDITDVYIYYIKCQEDCSCDTMSQKTCSSLRKMKVFNCEQLKHVFCLSSSCFCSDNIKYLEVLYLRKNGSLTDICKEEVLDVRPSLSLGATFNCMKDLQLVYCDSIEKLLTPRLVLHLPNLESISVHGCNSIQEILAMGNIDSDDGSSNIVLPKLTTLVLSELPRLKHVLKMLVLQLPNLESIKVRGCTSMEEIFIVGNGDDYGSLRVELPKLTELVLLWLPQLKTVCKEIISFGSLSTFNIYECPNFDWIYPTIPFQLHVDDGGRLWSDDDYYYYYEEELEEYLM